MFKSHIDLVIKYVWLHELYIHNQGLYPGEVVQPTLPFPSFNWADLRCFAQPDAYAYACLNGTSGGLMGDMAT